MVNYQLGTIYRIVCNTTGLTYYGSTCENTLARRLSKHKALFKLYLNGNFSYITSFELLKNNNYEIILVESYPCNSKDELHSRERFYIENNECVNKLIPTRQSKEYYETNKEKHAKYMKQYYQSNKGHILEHNKQYREANIEAHNQYRKQYRKLNKNKISEYRKQYRDLNRQKIEEKRKQSYQCVCGSVFRLDTKQRHLKTQKHQRYLEQNQL